MSPDIGQEKSLVVEGKRSVKYFTIDLLSEKSFDFQRLRDMARSVEIPLSDRDHLKFLVIDNVTYVFSELAGTHKQLRSSMGMVEGELQCAGDIKIGDVTIDDTNYRGVVYSISDSLGRAGLLDNSASMEYAKSTLKGSLGSFFLYT